jgi:predicted Fe-Mo cluster-binding NifX family protein
VEVEANAHAVHEHGSCNPAGALVGLGVDVVVCRGLGWRALAMLEQQGITVFRTEDWAVAEAVNAFRAHRLPVMSAAHTCHQEP